MFCIVFPLLIKRKKTGRKLKFLIGGWEFDHMVFKIDWNKNDLEWKFFFYYYLNPSLNNDKPCPYVQKRNQLCTYFDASKKTKFAFQPYLISFLNCEWSFSLHPFRLNWLPIILTWKRILFCFLFPSWSIVSRLLIMGWKICRSRGVKPNKWSMTKQKMGIIRKRVLFCELTK